MSILQNLFQSNKYGITLAKISGLISVLVLITIVGVVLYKAFSIALFESESTAASSLPVVKDEQLKQALDIVNKWNRYKNPVASPTSELEQENVEGLQVN
jgi:hypothetical protein